MTTTAGDVLEIVESPDLTELDEASSRGLFRSILIAAGVAAIAIAAAVIVSRRRD